MLIEEQSKEGPANIDQKNKSDLLKRINGWGKKSIIFGGIIFLSILALIIFGVVNKNTKPSSTTILEEAGSMKKSTSSEWWLNSGGMMEITQEGLNTISGNLDKNNSWRKLYAKSNPTDTDEGYHPQNIFRLVTKSQWQDLSQKVYFKISKINLSTSKNRNESNGALLFNRYQDGDNLYYAGVRVDGDAVIKKKTEGKYYTLAEKPVFTKETKYDRLKSPNLIPENAWIGIKTELKNTGETVNIKLYMDKEGKGAWQLILETQDSGDKYGKSPFLQAGYGGIRTDFMDVYFKNYSINELK
jgi:hypothetical protein